MSRPDAPSRGPAAADAWQDRTEPEDPDRLPADFLVEGRSAVRAIFDDLCNRRVLVTLYAAPASRRFAIVRIEHVDDAEVEIDLGGQDEFAAVLQRSAGAIGVAFPDRIKIQFGLEHLAFRRTAASHATILRAPIPARLHRLQRRDAFRVRPPAADDARCVRILAPDSEVSYPIRDISACGLSILYPSDEAPPEPGSPWTHCRIEAGQDPPIPCELVVTRITPASGPAHLVGLSFAPMPSEVLRRIQMLVVRTERRLRPA